MIKLISNGEEIPFTTTIFPDKTSQIWKIEPDNLDPHGDNIILWLFESEAELFHVCQLTQLLHEVFDIDVDLRCPYLPFGRQDKILGNHASFALSIFKDVLYNAGICRIETFDAHSRTDMIYLLDNVTPADFHLSILNHDVICYPDKGAAARYSNYGLPTVFCEKVRDQATGNILGLKVVGNTDLTGKRVLIIDDICDGGMTFIKTAEALKPFKPTQIDLAVSHGLFSKGRSVLYEAGITDIYTTNSLLRNPEGFKVW